MKDLKLSKKTIAIILGAIFIIAAIIISILVNREKTYEASLAIDDFETYFPDLSKNLRNELFYNLHTLSASQSDGSVEIPDTGAIIREDSIEKTDDTYTFIVDIDSIKQSYVVVINPKNNENHITFHCPTKAQTIYKETFCDLNSIGYSPSITLKHGYLITGILGEARGQLITSFIEEFVTSKNERLTAPGDHEENTNFTFTLNERSYTSYSNTYIYSVEASVDDGRYYRVYINNKDVNRLAAYIIRTDIDNHSYATIYSNDQNNQELENWINSFSSGVTINYKAF